VRKHYIRSYLSGSIVIIITVNACCTSSRSWHKEADCNYEVAAWSVELLGVAIGVEAIRAAHYYAGSSISTGKMH
jgi:hypothetical protein